MRAYILHGAVRCGAGAGLNIEVCGAVRAPALDDGAVRCGCGPLHCGAVRSRAKPLYIMVAQTFRYLSSKANQRSCG